MSKTITKVQLEELEEARTWANRKDAYALLKEYTGTEKGERKMRDRLIQLIMECNRYTPENSELARRHAEFLAQHLLNNNVIVKKHLQKGEREMMVEARAVEAYGKDMQLNVAVEEFSELIKEICKNKRGADNREAIIEEIADCYIMIKQLEIIFDIEYPEIAEMKYIKKERLRLRLEGRSENGKET
jgi:NTP pyrophosphatase (non-canonical NTP hydrolase)